MSDARFKVTYTPEGLEGDPKVWEVDVIDGLRASELIALKKVSGGSISGVGPLIAGISEMDGEAMKGILWLLLKRGMSTIPWDGLDFAVGELSIEPLEEVSDGRTLWRLRQLKAQDKLNALGRRRLDELELAGVEAEPEDVEDPKA